ncbi:MAG: guanylate kinase [Succinatimonas sp.]|nr:guanylate kinase [Succinatimonas sp.]
MMIKGTLFIISAPSGAGKSSLISALLERFNLDDKLRLSVSHTTRAIRPGEVDHVSYHFVSQEEFDTLVARNAFYEYAKVFENSYGTSREIVEQWLNEGHDVLLDIDWQGARQIRKQTPDAQGIFIIPPSLEELERRLVNRGTDSAETIQKRMLKATNEISHADEYEHIIINDNFEQSLLTLRSIILANRATRKNILEQVESMFPKP